MSDSLQTIVEDLISSKKEGVYWDFKEEYHSNNVDLVLDIICLANANHDGDRYIIFGVTDKYEIKGLSSHKKNQANIIDSLRKSNFADDIFPDISIQTILIEKQNIDILIIKNTKYKPYYLSKEKKEGRKYIYPGTIYSRIMDTNTPKDRVASSKDIERMWKERFGLNQTPIDRFKIYLNDFDGWEERGEHSFYRQHPEYTIRVLDENYCDGAQDEEWARGEIGYNYKNGNDTYVVGFFYHSTLLFEICCVIFDGGKKTIVTPDWKAIGNGRVYYYLEDSMKYQYQKYLSCLTKKDDSKNLMYFDKSFQIPLFANEDILLQFIEHVEKQLNIPKDSFLHEPESDKDKQNEFFHNILDLYSQWKEQI